MVFVLTVILVFFAIFQPGVIIPALAPARPFFLIALLSLLAWIMSPSQKSPFKQDPRLSYCIIGLVAAQSISVLQFLYIPQLLDITIMWCKFLLVYFLVVNVTTDDLVIDCDGLGFIDSTGVGMLVRVKRLVEMQERGFRVTNLTGMPRRSFELVGLIDMFGIDKSESTGV